MQNELQRIGQEIALQEDMRVINILKKCHFCIERDNLVSVRIEAPPGIRATSYLACPQHRTKAWRDHFEELWVIQERDRLEAEYERRRAEPTLQERAEKWLEENPESSAAPLVRELLVELLSNEEDW